MHVKISKDICLSIQMAKIIFTKEMPCSKFLSCFLKLGLLITGRGGTRASVFMRCTEDRWWSRFSFTWFTWVLGVRFRYKSWAVSVLTHWVISLSSFWLINKYFYLYTFSHTHLHKGSQNFLGLKDQVMKERCLRSSASCVLNEWHVFSKVQLVMCYPR